jgi:ureidoacrylate peracid hydrolase
MVSGTDSMTEPVNIEIPAEPEVLAIQPQRSVVIVVDMQNGFVSTDGYLARAGYDVSGAAQTVENCEKVLDAARRVAIPIVYLQMGWFSEMHDAGRVGGSNWHKSTAWRLMRTRTDLAGTAITRGTWDYKIVDQLQPRDGDIVVPKTRLSGFFETNLDSILRARKIESIAFVGIATNVCVEATIRDAFYRDYLPLLISDATNEAGPQYLKDATVFNVQNFLGWVTDTQRYCGALLSLQQSGGRSADNT